MTPQKAKEINRFWSARPVALVELELELRNLARIVRFYSEL